MRNDSNCRLIENLYLTDYNSHRCFYIECNVFAAMYECESCPGTVQEGGHEKYEGIQFVFRQKEFMEKSALILFTFIMNSEVSGKCPYSDLCQAPESDQAVGYF